MLTRSPCRLKTELPTEVSAGDVVRMPLTLTNCRSNLVLPHITLVLATCTDCCGAGAFCASTLVDAPAAPSAIAAANNSGLKFKVFMMDALFKKLKKSVTEIG